MRRRSFDSPLSLSNTGLAILTRKANLVKRSSEERPHSDEWDKVTRPREPPAQGKDKASSKERTDDTDDGSPDPRREDTTAAKSLHKPGEKAEDNQCSQEMETNGGAPPRSGEGHGMRGENDREGVLHVPDSDRIQPTWESVPGVPLDSRESSESLLTATSGSDDGGADEGASQTETLRRELRNIKVAMGNMVKEVQQSYEAAHGVVTEKNFTSTKAASGSNFVEAQEVKKTFYMAEVTSATAKLAGLLRNEDVKEFEDLRDATKTLYELQTRKAYFEKRRTESTGGLVEALFTGYTGIAIILLCSAVRGDWFNLCVAVVLLLGRLVAGAVASGVLRRNWFCTDWSHFICILL